MISIVAPDKDTSVWVEAIHQIAPEVHLSVWPEVDPASELLLCWNPPIDTFDKLPNLKAIYVMGAGIDAIQSHPGLPHHLPIERLKTQQLASDMFDYVFNCLETWRLGKHKYLTPDDWQPQPYRQRKNLTVCVLGLGNIGSYVATQLHDMGYSVRGWSRSEKSLAGITTYHDSENLNAAVKSSDALVCLLSLNEATRDVMNESLLSQLNKHSCVINVARGEHLVEDDLISVLNGPVEHAFLDVFRTEPLPNNHPFWTNKHISITPHIASLTDPHSAAVEIVDFYHKLINDA